MRVQVFLSWRVGIFSLIAANMPVAAPYVTISQLGWVRRAKDGVA